jgi:hypothetical protein
MGARRGGGRGAGDDHSEPGLTVTNVLPCTTVFTDARAADQVLGLRRTTDRAVAAGCLPRAGGDHCLDHLATRPFFASASSYVVSATN